MKKILFYVLLLFQLAAVLLIVWQSHLINKYGEERTFITSPIKEEDFVLDDIQDYETYTFEFEINNIPKEKWDVDKQHNYRDPVYVLLKENKAGVYEVIKATNKEITTKKNNEIVLIGKDAYESEDNVFHVNYGFETVNVKNHEKLLKNYQLTKPTKITYKFAPWKQSKLISID
ncbi:MAG TPA: GDYXXLXY domain-containing protein [Pseudogracilibacillus sp.]|nr:GDYXXLXY domain-containing protein [Pseudogracilibacillus sp.]